MVGTILHVGAHRTGTTSFQRFLNENTNTLDEHNIKILCPPECRVENAIEHIASTVKTWQDSGVSKILISEENFLGTMEHNIEEETLYPNAKFNLARLAKVIQPDVVMVSIRELGDYWTSAMLFAFSRDGIPFPKEEKIEAIAKSARTWGDVVDDIISVFPKSKVIVREFENSKDNPKRFLRLATGWAEWGETKLNRHQHNKRPGQADITAKLIERRNFDALSRLGETPETVLFNRAQRCSLHEAYGHDLENIWRRLGASFLEARNTSAVTERNAKDWSLTDTPSTHKTAFLHIGKTGGTYLKTLAQSKGVKSPNLYFCSHSDTLLSTMKKLGHTRKLAFFFRAPQERFVSGFNARLRQGRPTYNVVWTTAEAAAFSEFRTPNALAEALFSDDDYLQSAARFAMQSIFHLHHNYKYFLHSAEAIRYEAKANKILVCCETDNIDQNLDKILEALSVSGGERFEKNADPNKQCDTTELSELGKANLREFWKVEYEIYDACRTIADELGFGR